ncbi:putative immunity protein [Streptomyces sp. NPDC054933]
MWVWRVSISIDGARAFARGEMRIGPVRALSASAHAAAREVGYPSAMAAARAAGHATAVAHMAAHAHGVAYAEKASGLAAPHHPTAVADEARWQLNHASPAVRDVLRRLPAPPRRPARGADQRPAHECHGERMNTGPCRRCRSRMIRGSMRRVTDAQSVTDHRTPGAPRR